MPLKLPKWVIPSKSNNIPFKHKVCQNKTSVYKFMSAPSNAIKQTKLRF